MAIPLEANVLGLRENGQLLFIVSLDWFFNSPGLRNRILDRCAGRLDECNLFVAASHTHTSPNPDPSKVGFSAVDETYVSWAEEAIANLVDEMHRSGAWRSVRLHFSTAPCDCAMHRRRKAWVVQGYRPRRVMSLCPNSTGPRDDELRLLSVEEEDRNLMAVIWGVSCHPTEWPRDLEISSDYPGGVREALRAQGSPGIPILFLQGFCGDLRPPAVGRWPKRGGWRSRVAGLVSSLLNGPLFTGFSPPQYQMWVDGIAASCRKALSRAAKTPPLVTKMLIRRRSIDLSAFGLSGKMQAVTIHLVELNERLSLLGISAEVCWEYADLVTRVLAGKTVWPVGYIDSVFGYLPTESMLPEEGYEVVGFKKLFGITGDFAANLEEIVTEAIS